MDGSQHPLLVLGLVSGHVTEFAKTADIRHSKPDTLAGVAVELDRSPDHGEALPAALLAPADFRDCVEVPAVSEMPRDDRDRVIQDLVREVDQHRENPYEVEFPARIRGRKGVGLSEDRRLVLQAGISQIFVRLFDYADARVEADVVAGLEILD